MNGANLAMGHRLKRRREEIGLSQQQLALRIRKTQSCISLWENGVNGTNMDCFFELADVLRVDARWLATGKHG
jgi:transcriptional regulator with XRE-family HTH domain